MAKNKNNRRQEQRLIPDSMVGRTFSSFGDLGNAIGVKLNTPEDTYSKECNRCGSKMVRVPGTNVWVCHGKNDKGEDCGNRLAARVRHES